MGAAEVIKGARGYLLEEIKSVSINLAQHLDRTVMANVG